MGAGASVGEGEGEEEDSDAMIWVLDLEKQQNVVEIWPHHGSFSARCSVFVA